MRRRISEHFPPGTNHPAIPQNPPFARPLLHAFSLMYSQIFVSNATLSFSQQPRPPSQARPVCSSHIRAGVVREYANGRDERSPLFHPPSRGGIHFAAQRPRLPRTAPRSIASIILTLFLEAHPFSRSPTTSALEKSFLLFFDLDSPFSFRDIGKRPYTSRRCGPRRGDPSPQVYPEIPDGFHLHQKGNTLETHGKRKKYGKTIVGKIKGSQSKNPTII